MFTPDEVVKICESISAWRGPLYQIVAVAFDQHIERGGTADDFLNGLLDHLEDEKVRQQLETSLRDWDGFKPYKEK